MTCMHLFLLLSVNSTYTCLIKKGIRALLICAVQLQLDCIPVLRFFTKWALSKITDCVNALSSS